MEWDRIRIADWQPWMSSASKILFISQRVLKQLEMGPAPPLGGWKQEVGVRMQGLS